MTLLGLGTWVGCIRSQKVDVVGTVFRLTRMTLTETILSACGLRLAVLILIIVNFRLC